jgi:peptide/nickel transport system substrate-binding protein
MLAEATGATFHFGAPHGRYLMDRQVGEAIAGYLSAVGLNVKFENPIGDTFVSEITKNEKSKYDGFLYGCGVLSGDADWQLYDQYRTPGVRRLGYSNPEVDGLLDTAKTIVDNEKKVKAIFHKVQEIVWDECPWLWTYEQLDICAINKKLNWSAGRLDELYLFHEASLNA